MHACTVRLPALTRSCALIWLSSTSCYVTASSLSARGQFQTSVWKSRQWWEFGNKTIIFHHPSLGFSPGKILGAAVWHVIKMEFGCERAPCENRASLVAAHFSIVMPFTHMVDCISSMLRAGVEPYILPKKIFCFLNGAVTKNRTLAKPSCQVRRLSKLKSACLIYSYSFVYAAARRVPSFVEAWLCYAHGSTFLALFPLPSPKPIGMAF